MNPEGGRPWLETQASVLVTSQLGDLVENQRHRRRERTRPTWSMGLGSGRKAPWCRQSDGSGKSMRMRLVSAWGLQGLEPNAQQMQSVMGLAIVSPKMKIS